MPQYQLGIRAVWGTAASSSPAHVKPREAEMISLPSDTPVPLPRAKQIVVLKTLSLLSSFCTVVYKDPPRRKPGALDIQERED